MSKHKKNTRAVSNAVFVAVAVILIIIAAVGFALYATKPSTTSTVTTTVPTTVVSTVTTPGMTTTSTQTVTATQTVTSTQTQTVTSTLTKPVTVNSSGAFYNGQVITFQYTAQFMCTPPATTFFPNETNQSKAAMGCEVGAGNISAFPKNAAPVFVLVPAFAGLSIFGPTQLNATPQGFPTFTYNNVTYVITTQCGAAGTMTACPDHMTYIYSPAFTAVEQALGIKNGVFNLPEGVLPTPAHDHLVTFTTNQSIPWYIVVVLVFDPNIFPNPITGQCQAIVPSNTTNPTANCLNNIQALENAMMTYDSAVGMANAKNPIWTTLVNTDLQVVVPGITSPSQLMSATNSNMVLYFSDPAIYPYPI
ncbi:hypothetical protein [Sulfolobus acidocaldarius]|uniref:Conserved protein n=3 Tax=Sulfolobus acidocaldarius TaxID=2285 RepID=Q4JBQ3_SULAC|nr:hypothetical protein [Sulfolobus acidocaldarius]AAY79776.1 conserved protein [Sulfolobus acidocaldarius DSM 639]AGE70334.1 hypothetical protein SacN8_01765 [Sulfolobus acidocaldarius N8]AGE72609.1 hypothetical protein SacRon12I_01765 [Sulfolobus acidocaldarius Ron12/I]